MNKFIGGFLIGAGVGVIGTTLAVRNYYENKMMEELDRNFNREEYELKREEKQEPEQYEDTDEPSEKKTKREAVDYTSYFPKEEEETDLPMTEEFPYVITEEEYFGTHLQHDQLTLYYYKDNDVLVNADTEEVVEDLDIVGDSYLMFGLGSNNEDIVYVRNDSISTDFEIVRKEGFYEQK